MSHPKRIYLAGPEVFFPAAEHRAIVAEKKRLLADAGMEGVDPLDSELELDAIQSKREQGFQIFRANKALMDTCDGLIANLTPFRGVSADPGTVFEVGYMIGQGKSAIGFTMDRRSYVERAGGASVDECGHVIEDFDLSDNLMIEGALADCGGELVVARGGQSVGYFDSETFARCVSLMAGRKFQ
ncbi:nucleoside 2-deoxyribosyltransferase [Marinobacter sp. CHS3-4]|uniref:nucleoside 2-deoxyribosyltransferase n=1 Tax=Marinobacter sp. CHS3-4 TaxID=3045174 RepID=UPI0024B58D3A|nr:nucleoside 2-deoxyribosyltransferase [Marinobacter sp. CHS3-4]MDI9246367.1 nucleoside 2-deoxyribosyltransferase [Marinobacter sp. CHS3-4]